MYTESQTFFFLLVGFVDISFLHMPVHGTFGIPAFLPSTLNIISNHTILYKLFLLPDFKLSLAYNYLTFFHYFYSLFILHKICRSCPGPCTVSGSHRKPRDEVIKTHNCYLWARPCGAELALKLIAPGHRLLNSSRIFLPRSK